MGSRAWFIWLISNLIVIFSNMQIIYTFISVNLEKELGITIAQVALANSAYTWTFAISQFFSGAMFNVFSSKKIYFFSLSIMIFGFFVLINSDNFAHLILSQLLIAIGASFGFIGAAHISSTYFPITQFGLMFSLVQTISSLSALTIQMLFSSFLAEGTDWKNLIVCVILFGVSIFVLMFFYPEGFSKKSLERYIIKSSIKTVIRSVLMVLKLRDIWITSIVGAITFGTFLALNMLWAPRLLINLELNTMESGVATAILWLGLAIGAPIADLISNLFENRRHVISAFALLQGISIIILLYSHLTAHIVYFCMLMFGFFSGGHMLNFTVGSEIVERKYISTSSSIINGFMFIVSGIVVSVLALFPDYQKALFTVFAMLAVASILNYATKETYYKNKVAES
ncbi:major facilitator family transporter [Wolbachia endosymbiont of Armadillidium vulgare str. wVulC]|uniref:MFS transporter n=1 Tax=Wolbachia endosymbiont of Armadillidium vulgare TaxID=77039 RepID=UPI00064B0423|nr:MFS transporter [Wolbachia endosymbiont of Armadillidium vulgare]KLT22056.1 major facilitator family transporter [Wolbachia endosymbiont of Armadillidium vulgare str. wVulC]OJH31049.1 putative glucarate transporter [Wolbachia endosymbiont of Armadillidium vulgare]OJH33108.1 putative glucarate transporter [Wolbachia endosymbiont of Armadillidium vulgare]